MELKSFIKVTIDVTLKKLEQDLREMIEHILLLSDYHFLTDVEINNNNVAFQWYHRIPEILDENEAIIGNKTLEFQEAVRGAVRYKGGGGDEDN